MYQDLPADIEHLVVEYSVRGEDIRQEGNQFDNCYVGFIYKDSAGNSKFVVNSYEGTFDWTSDSLELDLSGIDARDAQFMIFLSQTGKLWVDEVTFSE